MADGNGNIVTCHTQAAHDLGIPLTSQDSCRSGRSAAEFLTMLRVEDDATQQQKQTCASAVAVGWMRTTQKGCTRDRNGSNIVPDGRNTLMLKCQPRLIRGDANIVVDSAGYLKAPGQ